jgi:hypothetical protein
MRPSWKDAAAAPAAGGVMAAYVAAAIVGLITGDNTALTVLMAATIAAWLIATTRHALTTPTGPGPGRDTHEVIHPEKTAVQLTARPARRAH